MGRLWVTVKRYEASFCGKAKVLKLIVLLMHDSILVEYTKRYWIVHFKR